MTRIAVVNDDTVLLDLMANVLQERGWDTVVHREGRDAFDALKDARPDLIILDIRLETPESGWNLLELLRLDRQTSDIPVIVCSAALLDLRAHEAWLNEHGIMILPKPFDIEDLYRKVEAGLGSRSDR